MTTDFRFEDTTDLEWSDRDDARWKVRRQIGRWLYRYAGPVREMNAVKAQEDLELARSPEPRLNEAEIQHISAYLSEVFDREIRRAYFETTPLDRTFPGLLIPLVDAVLARDPSVRTVADIGAYYFFVDHLLASRHPDIRFLGVDFPERLAEFNAEFLRDNLQAVVGYPLDLIERGALRADLVVFSATGAEIKNAELRRYLERMQPFARWIIFSEPLYNLHAGGIIDPDQLPVDRSLAIYAQPEYLPHRKGPLARAHNYRAMLTAAGYTVRHYHAFRPAFTDIRWVQVVAENTALIGQERSARVDGVPGEERLVTA